MDKKRNYFTPMKYYRDKKTFVKKFFERNKCAATRANEIRTRVLLNTPSLTEHLPVESETATDSENNRSENSDLDNYSSDADNSGSIATHVEASQSRSSVPDDVKYSSIFNHIRQWALIFNVNHNALTALLAILRDQLKQSLPKDSRTLLKTPSTGLIEMIGGGELWYHGIANSLKYSKLADLIDENMNIFVNFNVDGMNIHNNGKKQFWPILMNIVVRNVYFLLH